jgi:hypothetical protein
MTDVHDVIGPWLSGLMLQARSVLPVHQRK